MNPNRRRKKSLQAKANRVIDNNLNNWINLFTNEPVFILGNGPSLPDKEQLSLLDNHFSLGTNRIYFRYDPTIHLSQDELGIIQPMQAIRLCRQRGVLDAIHFTTNCENTTPNMDWTPNLLLLPAIQTGLLAVYIAYCLGCSPIVLLGMDGRPGTTCTHFWGERLNFPEHTWQRYDQDNRELTHCPTPIINCSACPYFPKQELPEVMQTLPTGKGREYYTHKLLESINPIS